jgi:acetylornithine deacetylase/succinyl-diaminopimelate desuccinylase-like protein
MEEWCDGIAPTPLSSTKASALTFVVIGEPTKMQVYRGHKGRVEIEVISRGRSAHAASNHLGDNAIYKVLPLIEGVSKLEPQLGDDPFLGHGKITVTDMKMSTPSRSTPCPTWRKVYIDRRVTFGESGRRRHRAGARPGSARTAGQRRHHRRDDEVCRSELHRLRLPGRQVLPRLGAGRAATRFVQAGLKRAR